jgi:hypothetical protein
MPRELVAYSLSEHPAPQRDRVGIGALFYGLFAPPIVWSGQLMASYALMAHACYPGDLPLASADPGFGWAWTVGLAIDLLALVLITSAILVAIRSWRMTEPPEGHHHHLLDVGQGRIHYLSICGAGFGIMFLLIVATEAISFAMVPLCAH